MSPYVQTNYSSSQIRVALIIEGGKVKPVWFEETDRPASDRIFLKTVNSIWTSLEGSSKVMHFAVTGGDRTNYQLSLDTKAFTWRLGVTDWLR
jgi:hypothetical protein